MALPLPARIAGLKLRGATLLSGENLHEFGYIALTKCGEGWRLALTNTVSRVLQSGALPDNGLRAAR